MQGKKAEKDVCQALEELMAIKDLDVIVVTRGGGSIADLSDFDSQLIAEKIASCPIPVLSGIGHEIDITITDMAAHTFAKTPTAIAQFLVNRVRTYLETVDERLEQIFEVSESYLNQEKQKLKDISYNLHQDTVQFFKEHNERLVTLMQVLKHKPMQRLKESEKALEHHKVALLRCSQARIKNEQLKLGNLGKMIDILHPVNTMKRGFSIARTVTGKIVRQTSDLKPQEELITELIDGKITSSVQSIQGERNRGGK
jgi:exodeoxyribonuclease VII large subunit